MKKAKAPEWIDADGAKEYLGLTTREAVLRMIARGKFPGAFKANPNKRTSPWLLPLDEVKAEQQND